MTDVSDVCGFDITRDLHEYCNSISIEDLMSVEVKFKLGGIELHARDNAGYTVSEYMLGRRDSLGL
jgi:hypothetical protein